LTGEAGEVFVRDADALGDWSDARDVVRLMASVARSNVAEDYVVASGSLRSVRDVVESSLKLLGIMNAPIHSSINNLDAEGRWALEADNSKAKRDGHWAPILRIEETIAEIVRSTLKVK
jgi:GDPmannose 4,6-dehydratase